MEDASANLFTAGSMSPMDPIANSTVDELNTAPTTSADANTSTTTNDEDVGDVTSPSASSDQPTPSSDSIITSPDASPMMMMEHYRGDGTDAFVQELFGTPPVVFSSCPLLDADMFRAYVNYLYHDSTYMRRPPLRLKSAIRSLEQQHRDALKQLRGRVKAFEALDAIIHIRRREQVALQWGDKLSRLEASLVKSAGNDKSIAAISEKILALKEESDVIEAEVAAIRSECEEYANLCSVMSELTALEESIGLASLRRELSDSQSSQGRSLVSSGSSFENRGAAYVNQTMLLRISETMGIPLRCLRYTTNLTLHIPAMSHAAGEFDDVIFEIDEADADTSSTSTSTSSDAHKHIVAVKRVLYIIEIKRYINDIGPALPSRLKTLHWLAGLIPDREVHLWTNRFYPKGRYNFPSSPSCHEHVDPLTRCRYIFSPDAFNHFADLQRAGKENEFVHFFVKRADITCMDSEDTNRVADWLSTHTDYHEDASVNDDNNARVIEFIRGRCLAMSKNPPDMETSYGVITKYPDTVHYLA